MNTEVTVSGCVSITAITSMEHIYVNSKDAIESSSEITIIDATSMYAMFKNSLISNGCVFPEEVNIKLFIILSEISIINIGALNIDDTKVGYGNMYMDAICEELEACELNSVISEIPNSTKIIELLYSIIPEYNISVTGMDIADYMDIYIPVRWVYSNNQIMVHITKA